MGSSSGESDYEYGYDATDSMNLLGGGAANIALPKATANLPAAKGKLPAGYPAAGTRLTGQWARFAGNTLAGPMNAGYSAVPYAPVTTAYGGYGTSAFGYGGYGGYTAPVTSAYSGYGGYGAYGGIGGYGGYGATLGGYGGYGGYSNFGWGR
jgi:hypothetical protein